VAYALTLHEPGGQRVLGIDNAHVVRLTRGPAACSSAATDHVHRRETMQRYTYRDADDFWREVEEIVIEAWSE
jgi:hypothetical protein